MNDFLKTKVGIMVLPLAAALITLVLKFGAYSLTGSIAIFSDAAESLVNLTAAIITLISLRIAIHPADTIHHYGHDKAEYFASGIEGTMILAAAGVISYAAIHRLLHPAALNDLSFGLVITLFASLINLLVALTLLRAARTHDSIALEADAKHLLTDVWTSVGVVGGLGTAWATGLFWLDPAIALAVAANIIVSGVGLVQRSLGGLMDTALPPQELGTLRTVLSKYTVDRSAYHKLRTRKSGSQRFIDLHLLVPGSWTVQQTHNLSEQIETEIRQALGQISITIHFEPVEDEASWEIAERSPLQRDDDS
jgi:cation diffusion facilitator family transporter